MKSVFETKPVSTRISIFQRHAYYFLLLDNNINKKLPSIPKNDSMTIFDQLIMFINLWPISQWVFSLVSLVLMYWIIGSWYNKKLIRQGGWITWETRVIMIFIDLMLNLILGVYYMGSRDSIMGQIMLRCPIAISPLIFLIEFVVFIWYYKKYVLKVSSKSKKD